VACRGLRGDYMYRAVDIAILRRSCKAHTGHRRAGQYRRLEEMTDRLKVGAGQLARMHCLASVILRKAVKV